MVDGLGQGLEQTGSTSIATGGVGTSEVEDLSIATADIAAGAVTSAKIASAGVEASNQGFVGTGSPSVFGNSLQANTGATSAGSELWLAFPTPFGAAPTSVIATASGDTDAYLSVGSISAGSALVTSHNAASVAFAWQAVGSGDL